MFGRMWNFAKRHKKKLVFSGFVCGSFYFISGYIKRKLLDYQEAGAKELIKFIRRKNHYEMSQVTCNQTIFSLIPSLKYIICEKLNTEEIRVKLKERPSNSVELWNELKIKSFVRTLTALYSLTMLTVMLKVHLNVISGYLYHKNNNNNVNNNNKNKSNNDEEDEVDRIIRMRYMAEINYFFNQGMHQLIQSINTSVTMVISDVRLSRELNKVTLCDLINVVRRKVEMKKSNGYHDNQLVNMATFMLKNMNGEGNVDDNMGGMRGDGFRNGGEGSGGSLNDNEDFVHISNFINNNNRNNSLNNNNGNDNNNVNNNNNNVNNNNSDGGDDYSECDVAYACISHKVQQIVNGADFPEMFSSCLDSSFQFLYVRIDEYFNNNNNNNNNNSNNNKMMKSNLNEKTLPMAKVVAIVDGLIHSVLMNPDNYLVQDLIVDLEDFSLNVFNVSIDL